MRSRLRLTYVRGNNPTPPPGGASAMSDATTLNARLYSMAPRRAPHHVTKHANRVFLCNPSDDQPSSAPLLWYGYPSASLNALSTNDPASTVIPSGRALISYRGAGDILHYWTATSVEVPRVTQGDARPRARVFQSSPRSNARPLVKRSRQNLLS